MEVKDIVQLHLLNRYRTDNEFHAPRSFLKEIVNRAIDNLEWNEGFDIAVKSGELLYNEYDELYEVICKAYPDFTLNYSQLESNLDDKLFRDDIIEWIVAEDGSIIFFDYISLGRYQGDRFIWVTPRISVDRIDSVQIIDEKVKGFYHTYENDWKPIEFEIDFNNGDLIKGEVFNF